MKVIPAGKRMKGICNKNEAAISPAMASA